MHIDWFTLTAQVINFLVLVGLLRHFLYGPVLQAMDEREARIASRLQEAARLQEEGSRAAEAYRAQTRELESQREQLLARAREEADELRRQRTQEVRAEVEQLRTTWLEALRRERETFLHDLRERVGRQALAVAGRALADLADVELERQLVRSFLDRLRQLGPAERGAMVEAIQHSGGEVVVHSAFDIPAAERETLARTIREELEKEAEVRFEHVPDLVCGIELRARSHRLGWGLQSYLEALEEDFARVLTGDTA